MTEDERLQLLGTVSETHSALKEAALRLRRELSPKAPALKTAVKAEQWVYRLRRELQRMDPAEPGSRHAPLPAVRQGGKVVDIERLRRGNDRGGER